MVEEWDLEEKAHTLEHEIARLGFVGGILMCCVCGKMIKRKDYYSGDKPFKILVYHIDCFEKEEIEQERWRLLNDSDYREQIEEMEKKMKEKEKEASKS